MSLRRFIAGAAGGAVLGGGLSAALGAAAGATGSAILSSAGHAGYVASEAAKMGAIGSGILGGSSGAISGALTSCGFFEKSKKEEEKQSGLGTTISYVGGIVLGGLTGYGVMNASSATVMQLAQTAASFAVGGAVTMIPASCAILCIGLPLALAAVACLDKLDEAAPARPRV